MPGIHVIRELGFSGLLFLFLLTEKAYLYFTVDHVNCGTESLQNFETTELCQAQNQLLFVGP